MKWVFLFTSLCFYAIVNSQPLHVMSFNIRLNLQSDSLNAWTFRKDKASSQVLFHETHLLGVQEAKHDQMLDLQAALQQYRSAGVARDDGKEKGEYSALFYDTTRLKLLQSETFWLSETPTLPGSKSWDAAITRIVTWGRFLDLRTRDIFYAFNTHFDHMGKEARKQSAKLILEKARSIAGSFPLIVMGDFNSTPDEDPIRMLTDTTQSFHLTDAAAISVHPHYGPKGTFNGFGPKETSDLPIDFIFVRNGIRVLRHATISQTWKGRFSSDHFPVFASLLLPKAAKPK